MVSRLTVSLRVCRSTCLPPKRRGTRFARFERRSASRRRPHCDGSPRSLRPTPIGTVDKEPSSSPPISPMSTSTWPSGVPAARQSRRWAWRPSRAVGDFNWSTASPTTGASTKTTTPGVSPCGRGSCVNCERVRRGCSAPAGDPGTPAGSALSRSLPATAGASRSPAARRVRPCRRESPRRTGTPGGSPSRWNCR